MGDGIQQRFATLLKQFDIDDKTIAQYWQNLANHYQEIHRYYHNLQHIQALLNYFDILSGQLLCSDAVLLACFYHDVIYHTKGKIQPSNEQQSADFFVAELAKYLPQDLVRKVVRLIISTQNHKLIDKSDIDDAYFLDMDLSILGQNPDIYQQYSANIQREYQHILPIFYRIGRKKVLKQFLTRERLYFTELFFQQFEQQARQNIHDEIKNLGIFAN